MINLFRRNRTLALFSFLMLFSLACGVCGGCGGLGNRPVAAPVAEPDIEDEAFDDEVGGAVEIGEVVTARGIGANNQPQDVTDEFFADETIYIVAEIDRVGPGTEVFARLAREGQPIEDAPAITADREYTNTWLEFHFQPEREFEPGDYSITLFANGNPIETREFVVR